MFLPDIEISTFRFKQTQGVPLSVIFYSLFLSIFVLEKEFFRIVPLTVYSSLREAND